MLRLCLALTLAAAGLQAAPNFLILFVDDLGWMHVGYQGGKFDTPNIDRLAAESMAFSRAYIPTPTCSPSRAALLTGQHPMRLGLARHVPTGKKFGFDRFGRTDQERHQLEGDPSGFASRNWLPLEATTIAEALHPLGYGTAFFGKWHLGHEPYHPIKQGFDEQFGVSNFGHPGSYYPPYWPVGNPYADAPEDEYLTDRLADDVVGYLNRHKQDDKPFLASVFFYNVHTPHIGRKDLVAKYEARGLEGRMAHLAAMVEATDEAIGRMLAAIEGTDTVTVFLGDQGGFMANEPLRGGKPGGTALYEGGARVPLLIRWPGHTDAGAKNATPVLSTDIFPTLRELAGGDPSKFQPLDGLSLLPLLEGSGELEREALFLERHYEDQYAAVIAGDWKLVAYWSG
ncbi:MAG: sulfatase-like hydrolase/transferase, partial [Bryobacterales bacterium]